MEQALIKLLSLSCFLLAGISNADVFNTLNYSGRIVNYDGSPKTGSIELEVNFYNSLTSDTSVSSKDYSNVELTNGVFSLAIDVSSDRETIFNPSNETWIEITDKTNNRTYPRQKLEAVPYAHEAGGLAGYPLPSSVPSGPNQILKWDGSQWIWGPDVGGSGPASVGNSELSNNAVTSNKIVDGTITSSDLDSDSIDSTKIVDASITANDLAPNSVTTLNVLQLSYYITKDCR